MYYNQVSIGAIGVYFFLSHTFYFFLPVIFDAIDYVYYVPEIRKGFQKYKTNTCAPECYFKYILSIRI